MNTAAVRLFGPDSLIAVLWHFLSFVVIRLPVTVDSLNCSGLITTQLAKPETCQRTAIRESGSTAV